MKLSKKKILLLSIIAINSTILTVHATPTSNPTVNDTSEQYNFNIDLENLTLEEQVQVIDNKITENITSSEDLQKKIQENEKNIEIKKEELYNLQRNYLLQKKYFKLNGNSNLRAKTPNSFENIQVLDMLLKSSSISDFFKKIELQNKSNLAQLNANELFYNQEEYLILLQEELNTQIETLEKDKTALLEHKKKLETLKKEVEFKIMQESIVRSPIISNSGEPITPPDISAEASDKAKAIIEEAYKYLGVPYVWGGTTPNGFDCSGFTQYVFRKFGINIPRVSQAQQLYGKKIPISEAQPGDLLFNGFPAHHVSIYIGGGKYIHAPRTGDVIKISTVNWNRVSSVSRVI